MLNEGTKSSLKAGIDMIVRDFTARCLSASNLYAAKEDVKLFLDRTELLSRAEGINAESAVEMQILDQREGRYNGSLQDIADSWNLGSLDNRQNTEVLDNYVKSKVKPRFF